MTETYLVEIVHRTKRGAGRLLYYKVEAGSASHAYRMARDISGIHPRDVMSGYITCDPYKVDRAKGTR
jgi:hypothetical protein